MFKVIIDGVIKLYSNSSILLLETIVLIILFIISKFYYPKLRGFMGEFWVKKELSKLPQDKYIFLNNIMIKDDRGTHQIDHLVLSNFGIFVIEMKNYYGLIKGNSFDDKWCQYLRRTKHYFLNPIHQNYGHIKALSNLLNLDEKYFISIICFSNQAKLRVKSNNIVTQLDYLRSNILSFKDTICDVDIVELSDIISSNNIVDKSIRKRHIKNIHMKVNYDKKLENNMICPKCGSTLIVKNGKYGSFIGCSNFPECRFVKR